MLWHSIRKSWAQLVTRWNKAGIDWRSMTTAEILWMVHIDHVEYLKSEEPRKVRPYLISVGDEDELIAWDNEQMKSKK